MSIFEGFVFRRGDSPIHRLDPRVKFLYTVLMLVLAVMFSEMPILLILFLSQVPLVVAAGVQRSWAKTMRGSVFLALLIFFTNLATRPRKVLGGCASTASCSRRFKSPVEMRTWRSARTRSAVGIT